MEPNCPLSCYAQRSKRLDLVAINKFQWNNPDHIFHEKKPPKMAASKFPLNRLVVNDGVKITFHRVETVGIHSIHNLGFTNAPIQRFKMMR